MKKKIIVPTDLTKAAQNAIKQATVIAQKSGSSLTLLHVLDEKSSSSEEIKKTLLHEADEILKNSGVICDVLLPEGNIFEAIPFVASEKEYDLMVIGTHGIKGIRQSLFGSDILKLVSRIPIPVLVMQEESPVNESFRRVVLPVSSHTSFHHLVDAIVLYGGLFNTEVHLYSIHKPGFPWPDKVLKNIEEATAIFETNGIHMQRIKEEQKVYSQGFAKQTLLYSHEAGADIVSMISVPSEEYYYFAQSDKETMLMNEFHIPVLCTSGGKAL